MKHIVFILTCCLLLTACKTQRITRQQTIITDTTTKDTLRTKKDSVYIYRELVKRDTIIKVQQKEVRDTVFLKDMETSTTQSGKVLPYYREKYDNGIKAYLSFTPDSGIVYGCIADSLLLVISGMVTEKEYYRHISDSLQRVVNTSSRTEVSKFEQLIERAKPLWPYALIVIICAVVMLAAIWVLKKYF